MNPVTTPEKQPQSSTRAQNPLLALQKSGQSVWLDYIRRNIITNGELQSLIDHDGLRGITSNPSIFEKAIAGSTDYADFLEQLHAQGLSTGDIYERIAIRDIQDSSDLLLPVYKATNRSDGYVSLEVSPTLARDTQGTIEEARRLWKAVGRPNIMIKVPGTPEGAPAVRQLTSEGININITLLFAQEAYIKVAEAYIDGLEAALKAGKDISGIASVASFFVSRIDTLVDSTIDARLKTAATPQEQDLLRGLAGQGGDRERQAGLPQLPGHDCRPTLEGTGRARSAGTAPALGQHQYQEPEVSRRAVYRRADRAGHGQHHPARHHGRLPRPRNCAPHAGCRSRHGR